LAILQKLCRTGKLVPDHVDTSAPGHTAYTESFLEIAASEGLILTSAYVICLPSMID